MNRIKTLIVIELPLIVRGLKHYISQILPEPGTEVVDVGYLIKRKNEEEKCVIIIDPELLPDPKRVTIERIYKNFNRSKLVSLSIDKLPLTLTPYFDEKLYLTEPEDIFMEKVRCIYQQCDENITKTSRNSILSNREKEVLRAVALGKTNKEISDSLSISPHTVITHRKNISSKLGIKSIAGLTVYAILNGIISNEEINS